MFCPILQCAAPCTSPCPARYSFISFFFLFLALWLSCSLSLFLFLTHPACMCVYMCPVCPALPRVNSKTRFNSIEYIMGNACMYVQSIKCMLFTCSCCFCCWLCTHKHTQGRCLCVPLCSDFSVHRAIEGEP